MVTPEQLIDALNAVFGKQQPGARAVHAKGIVLTGSFTPNPSAVSISKAAHFQSRVPITCRLSDFAGVATIPDTDPVATPHGMAVRFHLPGGTDTDIVCHSFRGFPTATVDEFLEFALALGQSGPAAPKPTPLDKFLATHPIAQQFLASQQPPPQSYATLSYFGVNTFKFINVEGHETFGRYQIRAIEEKFLSPEEVARMDANYLETEIRRRVSHGKVEFNLKLELAEPGDALDDPSIAWPASRAKADLGTIELTQVAPDSAAEERKLLFNPVPNISGIEPRDPMIEVRSSAYLVSFRRRHG